MPIFNHAVHLNKLRNNLHEAERRNTAIEDLVHPILAHVEDMLQVMPGFVFYSDASGTKLEEEPQPSFGTLETHIGVLFNVKGSVSTVIVVPIKFTVERTQVGIMVGAFQGIHSHIGEGRNHGVAQEVATNVLEHLDMEIAKKQFSGQLSSAL